MAQQANKIRNKTKLYDRTMTVAQMQLAMGLIADDVKDLYLNITNKDKNWQYQLAFLALALFLQTFIIFLSAVSMFGCPCCSDPESDYPVEVVPDEISSDGSTRSVAIQCQVPQDEAKRSKVDIAVAYMSLVVLIAQAVQAGIQAG